MNISERVEALRQWMRGHSDESHFIGAYIIDTTDPHSDEYIPPHWMCREWITGFTGSAGVAVVTLDEAAMWTDSRYWLQAEEQLHGTPFTLMCEGREGVPSPEEWIEQRLQAYIDTHAEEEDAPAFTVAFPKDMANDRAVAVCDALSAEGYISEVLPLDAFDDIWADRPSLPAQPIYVQPLEYAGMDVTGKLELIRTDVKQALKEKVAEADMHLCRHVVFSNLSNVAWALNLRGADIEYNPVFLAYLAYNTVEDNFTLYTHFETLTTEARRQMDEAGVELRPYADALQLSESGILGMPEDSFNYVFANDNVCIFTLPNPITPRRQVKCEAEMDGFRRAMLQDGVAMVRFLRWLDEEVEGGTHLTELSVSHRLTEFRKEQPDFKGLSFENISAYAAHGAIVHYEPTEQTDIPLEHRSLLLLDSGGQYTSGTTDITRTIALGPLTDEERAVYTLVLKGHLALGHMHFPDSTTGLQLDTAARSAMWAAGYDFGHGTGHGVGSRLCVHEGDYQIRKDSQRTCTLRPFHTGMTVTDEPGIYVTGRFGVRIENTLLCVPSRTTGFGRFLRFEQLTLCPYDLRPVDFSMLTDTEVEQINAYHALVCERLLPHLSDEADRLWLQKATRPVKL